ncbi:MAG: hypothetical protein CVT94_11885 [Bacteroidetes bacterium HGW-Bacteroidetes-11]|nr:MAG: hypothetical protein CVT94_11885 [Bacteroidetes bacterium HGW-Bacteroidetes-11]
MECYCFISEKNNSGDENASFFTHPNPPAELEVKTGRFLSSLRCDRNDDDRLRRGRGSAVAASRVITILNCKFNYVQSGIATDRRELSEAKFRLTDRAAKYYS